MRKHVFLLDTADAANIRCDHLEARRHRRQLAVHLFEIFAIILNVAIDKMKDAVEILKYKQSMGRAKRVARLLAEMSTCSFSVCSSLCTKFELCKQAKTTRNLF